MSQIYFDRRVNKTLSSFVFVIPFSYPQSTNKLKKKEKKRNPPPITVRNLENLDSKTLTCLEKTAMSSLKLSDEQTSPPATPGSRGVHVASSHFSKINASSGNKGCL